MNEKNGTSITYFTCIRDAEQKTKAEYSLQALLRLGRVRYAMLCILLAGMLSTVIAVQTGKVWETAQAKGARGRLVHGVLRIAPHRLSEHAALGQGLADGGAWRGSPQPVCQFLGPQGGPVRPSRIAASRCCLAGGAARHVDGAVHAYRAICHGSCYRPPSPATRSAHAGRRPSAPWPPLSRASPRRRPPRTHAPALPPPRPRWIRGAAAAAAAGKGWRAPFVFIRGIRPPRPRVILPS